MQCLGIYHGICDVVKGGGGCEMAGSYCISRERFGGSFIEVAGKILGPIRWGRCEIPVQS